MSMVVKNNIAAQMVLGELNKSQNKLGKSLEKVSTGQKVVGAKDNASVYSISEKMREQIRSLDQDNQNVQNGSALFKIADGAINDIMEELRSLKELAINSANDTNTDGDRATIQKEFNQRMAGINDIATQTTYNGKTLLDGTYRRAGDTYRIEETRIITGYEEKKVTVHGPSVTTIPNADGTTTLMQDNKYPDLITSFSAVSTGTNKSTNPTAGNGMQCDIGFEGNYYSGGWNWAKEISSSFTAAETTSSSVTAQAAVKGLMNSLDNSTLKGVSALDEAIAKFVDGNGAPLYSSWSDLVSNMLSDLNSSATGTDFLKDYCGIDLTNTDTGAITGLDAGGSSVAKTAESIVPESSQPASWTMPTLGGSDTYNGLTVHWQPDSTTGNYGTLTAAQQHILKGLHSEWIPRSMELIADSFGMDFTSAANSTVQDIYVKFENTSNDTLAYVTHSYNTATGKANALTLTVNMKYYNSINTSSEDGATSSAGAGYLDRTIAHEFTHAVMAADITWFGELPTYFKEGMAELVHGIDDERFYSITQLVNGNSTNSLSAVLGSNSNTNTWGTDEPYSAGYILLRYFAKQISGSDITDSNTLQSFTGKSPGSSGETGVSMDFDFTGISNVEDLDGEGFSILCGGCDQYINITFDKDLNVAESVYELSDTDAAKSTYTIGIADVTTLDKDALSEAIFNGVNAAHTNSASSTNNFDSYNTSIYDSENDTTELVATLIDPRHNVRVALNPDTSTGSKYIFVKEASPPIDFVSKGTVVGISSGEIEGLTGDGPTYQITQETELNIKEPIYDYVTNEVLEVEGNPLKIHHGTKANQATAFFIDDMHTRAMSTGKLISDNTGLPIEERILNTSDRERYEALSYDEDKQAAWLETLENAQNKSLDDISVTTKDKAQIAIRVIDGALEYTLNQATYVGAYLQRLEFTGANVMTMNENVQASESTMRDADMAKEMTDYTKYNVMTQAAQSMLAQANQNSSAVLSLLQ